MRLDTRNRTITILTLLGLVCVLSVNLSAASIAASGTFTDSLIGPGEYQYDITLTNTGTTTIGTFWFSWIPGFGFMTLPPTNIQSPMGWTGVTTNSNMAIQWVDTGTLLAPGSSQSGFIFDSTLTPAQLEGPSSMPNDPVATSFVYAGAPLVGPGFQFVVTQAQGSVPEPATFALASLGIGLAAIVRKSLRRS